MIRTSFLVTLTAASLLAVGAVATAQEATRAGPARPWVWELAPSTDFYPPYLADPRRAQSAMLFMDPFSSEIPESTGMRVGIRLGGEFPILRWHPQAEPERGWQLDFEGGFLGQFDAHHSLDNIGWDGIYGLLATFKPQPRLGLRFGVLHDSAHVGDEYEERTGRRRIGYTREELVAGVSWRIDERWRVYGEVGHQYNEVKPFQAPLRLQAGFEHTGGSGIWRSGPSWYAATDLTAFEENDWRITVTAQLGIIVPVGHGDNRYRFAVELFDGRTALGEFLFYDESYLALGWYFDF